MFNMNTFEKGSELFRIGPISLLNDRTDIWAYQNVGLWIYINAKRKNLEPCKTIYQKSYLLLSKSKQF